MRADFMVWVQRLVTGVFAVGVVAMLGAIITQVWGAEGVPPLPVFLGLVGLCVMILLAGACLALMSLAVSAKRGAEALQRLSHRQASLPATALVETAAPVAAPAKPQMPRLFDGPGLGEIMRKTEPAPAQEPEVPIEPKFTAPARPQRPAGRTLVAER